ncbi:MULTISPECIES: hypothetical protein [unclassified Streptomyces]|uniref:hypothetical protein n=1 Tax=unclassified Streptomyces TaxID=2593676 RepID=UPI0022B5F37D|nr:MULTISPECIES: hypothetical protein [unclassified Streptomyces]MCZ7415274.1 hypothetical protein [Streptomyces sp. WMMC897]MCZ7432216.1 hypothetical protein [Streptomyces sp. WMMC1477]
MAQTRAELAEQAKEGTPPALDGERALAFAHEARSLSLTDGNGETVAVVVSPAVLEVLEDALGLLQGKLDALQGIDAPLPTEKLRDQLNGRMSS